MTTEGTEPIEEMDCHVPPCCMYPEANPQHTHLSILAPPGYESEAAELVKDHMAEAFSIGRYVFE